MTPSAGHAPAGQAHTARADRDSLLLMFGGTFDPVHNGHLRMAVELREAIAKQVSCRTGIRLVPCHIPAHRNRPGASAEQRLQMLIAAVADEPGLQVDRRELERAQPSYSVDTLAQLRHELGPDAPLAMAIGTDSYAAIDRWDRWRDICKLAHIVVIERPGYTIGPETEAGRLLSSRKARDFAELTSAPAGKVLPLSLSLLEISATDIRARIASGRSARYLVPDAVWSYICDHSLYSTQ